MCAHCFDSFWHGVWQFSATEVWLPWRSAPKPMLGFCCCIFPEKPKPPHRFLHFSEVLWPVNMRGGGFLFPRFPVPPYLSYYLSLVMWRSADPHLEASPPLEQINTWAVCLHRLPSFCTSRLFCREQSIALICGSLRQVMQGRVLRWHYKGTVEAAALWPWFIALFLGTHSICNVCFLPPLLWSRFLWNWFREWTAIGMHICIYVCMCLFVREGSRERDFQAHLFLLMLYLLLVIWCWFSRL